MDLWQWHCRNRREKKIARFGAMPLPKQVQKKKTKNCGNCGNAIAEIGG